jgi:hypothetical protein
MNYDCDKCGQPVCPSNNVTFFDAFRRGSPLLPFVFVSRHLLPVMEDGAVVCEGSPSRAQYLEGQPRDPRYPYQSDLEGSYRDAYKLLLEAGPQLPSE